MATHWRRVGPGIISRRTVAGDEGKSIMQAYETIYPNRRDLLSENLLAF
jgi:hypothetical protein